MIPFRKWLSQTTKPLLKASVGVLTSLVAVLVLFSILQNQKRAEESFQHWKRSAELLVQKRDLATLQGVSERFLENLPGSEFELKKSTQSLWRFPISENNHKISQILFNKTKSWQWTMITDPSVTASIKIPFLSIYKSTILLCGFLFFILILALFFLKHLYTLIANTLNLTIDCLARDNLSGVEELDRLVMSVRSSVQSQQKAESEAIIGRMASQVAHDITSPLVSLEMMISDTAELPESKRIQIQNVATRVKKIINQLKHRKVEQSERIQIFPLLNEIISEKREQFRKRLRLEINLITPPLAEQLYANIQPTELGRMISNLINNSVEAMEDGGRIEVSVRLHENMCEICVKDNGNGINPDVLDRLGLRGETHGKPEGTGLGLFHARTTVKSWGGSLTLQSATGEGTAVWLKFPAESTPAQTVIQKEINKKLETMTYAKSPNIILIDEDACTHIAWQEAAIKAGRKLQCLFSPELFSCYENGIGKDSSIYIDSRSRDRLTGLEFSRQLHEKGFDDLYLLQNENECSDFTEHSQFTWIKGVINKRPPFALENQS